MSLEGKAALITGGSRGIGRATVRLFRQAGAKVVFSYRSAVPQAESLVAECGGPGYCRAIQQPLSTPEDGEALVAAAVAAFGRLDCVVLNHGIWPSHDQPIATMTTEQWRDTLGTNLDSVFGVIRAAVAQMQSQPATNGARGHIVLVASTAAQRGEAFHADYAASKGALISLTKSSPANSSPRASTATASLPAGSPPRCPPMPLATPKRPRRCCPSSRSAAQRTSTRSPHRSSSSAPPSPASSPARSSTSTAALSLSAEKMSAEKMESA